MLQIYDKQNLIDKPQVFDCDEAFYGCKLRDNKFTRRVLNDVEMGTYVDGETFKDKFGRVLYANCLSTSAKILLLADRYSDYAFNCDEIGSNAVDLLLECDNAIIYVLNRDLEFKSDLINPVMYNNITFNNVYDLNEALAGGEIHV
jgi:hypothetical protein